MKFEKIKPIPKYIEQRIKKRDLKDLPVQNSYTRYYAYLAKNDGELVKVTVAVRNYRGGWYCKQVAVHGVHSERCYVKDLMRCYIGGFHTGWHAEGLYKHKKWYEDGEWGWNYDKELDPYAPVVNMEFIGKFPEYKYSGYMSFTRTDVLQYLRIYEQYPQAEYIVKLGLDRLAMKKQILKKAAKDKHFRRWLFLHRDELKTPDLYLDSIFRAYREDKPIMEVQAYDAAKKALQGSAYPELKTAFVDETDQLCAYIGKHRTSIATYADYFRACNYLGLDIRQEKHRYPHDFWRWHEIRIDEYNTAKAIADEETRKEFYEKFAVVATKYQALQHDKAGGYICLIARSPKELIHEGDTLQHCVGRMNYDQKFVREETLIFFVRNRETPETPFVTVEYSLSARKVLQCYGYKDHRPDNNVLDYVNRVWLPYANRKINKIAA